MSAETHTIRGRKHWQNLRAQDVTASVVGALLGVHEYETPFSLWAEKTGRLVDDHETPAMRRGTILEPAAVKMLELERPSWKVERRKIYVRDPELRLGATPDVLAHDPERGPGIVQIKTVDRVTFREKWLDDETGAVTPPGWIMVQAITEAHLTGREWCDVAALVWDRSLDLHIEPIPLHGGVVEAVREAVREFWAMVARGEAPRPDFARDADVLGELYGRGTEPPLDLTGTPAGERLAGLLQEGEHLGETMKAAKAALRANKAAILDTIQNASRVLIPGWSVSVTTVDRKEYTVKPASYSKLTFRKTP